MPAKEMEALFKRANLSDELISEIPLIIDSCKLCKLWSQLPPKQVSKKDLGSLIACKDAQTASFNAT